MINNIEAKEEYKSSRGWERIISYEIDGAKNIISVGSAANYDALLNKLISSQIVEIAQSKPNPYYQRIVYKKRER